MERWAATVAATPHHECVPAIAVRPPKPVYVRQREAWHQGHLEAWRRDDDGWRAYVRYSVGIGQQHLGWVVASSLRPA
jgi:hypothetical protein